MATFLDSINTPVVQMGLLRTHGAPCRVLGKRGILSQAAKEIPDLPPSFIAAVPVPTPALTANPPAAMGGVSPELQPAAIPSLVSLNLRRRHLNESQRAMVAAKIANLTNGQTKASPIGEAAVSQGDAAQMLNVGKRSVERAADVQERAVPDLASAVDRGKVSVSAAAEVARLPAEDQQAVVDAATARACHMRRALEGALDHGTALLAALGLPRLMEPGFVPLDPAAIGDALDTAIATLDALDTAGVDIEDEGEAEPSLGWIDGKPVSSDSHDDREAEDDDEPILGAPERHPAWDPWSSGRSNAGSQTRWSCGSNGSANDGEAEAGYDLPEGDDERCGSGDVDLEPSLGAPENHDRAPDQEHWAQGGYSNWSDVEIGEDESQTDKELPFDARQANEAAAREAGRQAKAMRRRKDLVTDENEVQFGNLRMIDGWTVREMWAAQ